MWEISRSFCFYKMRKFITLFQFESQFLLLSSFLLHTGCCSWHLFSAVIGSWIFSNMENIMASPVRLRSSSRTCIAASPILLAALMWNLLFLVLINFHKLDFQKFLWIIFKIIINTNSPKSNLWKIFSHYFCVW